MKRVIAKFNRFFVVLVILFAGYADTMLRVWGLAWILKEEKLTDIGFYCLVFKDIEISYWTVMDIGWFA